jgi:hypothetical protein
MINGIFTRHKTIPFQSTASGTSTIYTTTKKSFVTVEVVYNGLNSFVEVFWERASGGGLGRQVNIFTQRAYERGGGGSFVAQSGGLIVPAGFPIRIFRFDANIILHVFEME